MLYDARLQSTAKRDYTVFEPACESHNRKPGMKIGLIAYDSLSAPSGEDVYNRMLSERLQQEGDEIDDIVLPWQRYALRLADNLAEELFEQLREAPFDLLLQDEACHPSLFRLNRRLCSQVKYPIIAIVHHLYSGDCRSAWQNRFYCEIEHRYLETPDGFIFGSQTVRNVVEKITKGRRPAVTACPAGDRLAQPLAPEQIAQRVRESGPLQVLFIGDLSPAGELDILLDALGQLDPSTWHLTIVGSASVDRAYARSVADRLRRDQLLGRVTHTSRLGRDGLAARYARSHVLAAPSPNQEIDITYLEAMGFGLPVVAAMTDATGEIISHGVNGFLFPHKDEDALAGYLRTLSTDREVLLAMSLAAHVRFAAQPTWSESMGMIADFLHSFPRR
jgi:glycosyltransferase involved in cell wall biosynthesis